MLPGSAEVEIAAAQAAATPIPSKSTGLLQPIDGLVGPKDLTVEAWREYEFPDGSSYRIANPVALYYREGGTTHRIVDKDGIVHCIAYPGKNESVVLRWLNRDVKDPVTF